MENTRIKVEESVKDRKATHLEICPDKNSNVDVGDIAKKYGGGGHKSSAGFVLESEDKFPWKVKNS